MKKKLISIDCSSHKYVSNDNCIGHLLHRSVKRRETSVIVDAVVTHAGALAERAAVHGCAANVLHAAAAAVR